MRDLGERIYFSLSICPTSGVDKNIFSLSAKYSVNWKIENAEIINKEFNVDILEDERLVERGYGDFEGITKIELKEIKKKDSRIDEACNYIKNISMYNMETMQDLCKRIYDFLDEITQKYKDKNILLVTHGSASIPIKCYFLKYPLEKLVDREKIKGLENCEVVEFEI